jgi:hypothetical protein
MADTVIDRELLRWAVAYITKANDELAQSHTNLVTGEIDDVEGRAEVREAERWLRRAKAVM